MKHLIILIIVSILFFSDQLPAQQDSNNVNDKYSGSGLNDLINAAVRTNVRLEPIELKKKILSSKIDQAGFQSSPRALFMLDNLPVNFNNAGEYIFNFAQPLKLFGKTDASEILARTNSLLPQIEKEELQNELIRMVKENYFMLSVNERLLSFNTEFKEIMNSITGSMEIKYSSGNGNQYEILKSNNEYQKLLLEEIELSGNKKLIINNLRNLTNLELPDNYSTKNLDILLKINPPDLDTAGLITEMRSNNTDYKYLEQKREENKIELSIAELDRKPDLNLTTGYKYKTEKQESYLLFGIGIDLSFMPWNEKRIDAIVEEKILTEKRINSSVKSLDVNLRTELKNTLIRINSSLEKIKYLREVLIPQTEQTFQSSLISYETASNRFIDLLDTYRTLRENNQMLIKEETNYLILISGLEKLIGKQILSIN
ncbi:MAG TPA: TolC family protein [Ignavibacteria bacterium]|nr:TolC family protein [Ignavibacteria bacterium]HMR40272.1 TolC family protein [Ignavibacteria bacterium]